MNILFLTSKYPGPDIPSVSTAVCHYFVREWVKNGNNVLVIHNNTTFPSIINIGLRHFYSFFERKVGFSFICKKMPEIDYEIDGVRVYRRNILKFIPRAYFTNYAYKRQYEKIVSIINKENFIPDIIVGHWWTPQLRLVCELGKFCDCHTILVTHGVNPDLMKEYGELRTKEYLNMLDLIGYRSRIIKERCFERYGLGKKRFFMCYSGIPAIFKTDNRRVLKDIRTFTFVGSLIDRKYPEIILDALSDFAIKGLIINYIGDGPMLELLKQRADSLNMKESVKFHGRIPREDVGKILSETDCFIMVSRNETFGLVYLEAMSHGCITIGSKNEGIDGPIEDGRNGFLCEAGNSVNLKQIIKKLYEMPMEDVNVIAEAGYNTANKLTDVNVAAEYYKQIEELVK